MKIIKFLIAVYVIACTAIFFVQEKLIFAAHDYPEDQAYSYGYEVEIPLEPELSMNALIIPAIEKQISQGAILYLHGNRGNIRRAMYQSRVLQNRGLDIMIIDYRGYGKTEGKPKNDKQMMEDAEKAYLYLLSKYQKEKIYVVGYSLGTGMATHLAAKYNPAHLFLIAPFTSLVDIKNKYAWMVPDFLLKYKLNNKKHLSSNRSPVTIIHGTQDKVVDYAYSKELKSVYPNIELVSVKGQNHRGIIFDGNLNRMLDKYIP